jgi:hypothetical protein
VNLDGEIIGVNVMKVVAADGLSFAVPIDSIMKIMENFKKNGYASLCCFFIAMVKRFAFLLFPNPVPNCYFPLPKHHQRDL